MFACDTMSIGPFGSWLSTGAMILAQPELIVPMTATSFALATWSCAFFAHVASSHWPLAAVESS